jgi:hypothetical protein
MATHRGDERPWKATEKHAGGQTRPPAPPFAYSRHAITSVVSGPVNRWRPTTAPHDLCGVADPRAAPSDLTLP